MSSFFKHLQQSDADKLLILLEENRKLKAELAALKEAQLKDPFKMTEDELREFLSANGYDYDDLRRRGSLFIANLKNKLFQPPEAE